MLTDITVKKGKPKPSVSPFATARTREELATAIQRRLATGRLKSAVIRALSIICQLRGWTASPTRHFAGEKFSQAGINYIAVSVDEAGQVLQGREGTTGPPPKTTPPVAQDFV